MRYNLLGVLPPLSSWRNGPEYELSFRLSAFGFNTRGGSTHAFIRPRALLTHHPLVVTPFKPDRAEIGKKEYLNDLEYLLASTTSRSSEK